MTADLSKYHLADDHFWGGAARPGDPLAAAFRGKYFGVLIDAPHEVVLSARPTLPVFAYYMGTFREMFTRSFVDQALIVAIDPEANELYVAPAADASEERIAVADPTRPEDLPNGNSVEAAEIELRGQLQIPWTPGPLIAQVVMLDLASNRVTIQRKAGSGAFRDDEKERFLAAERARRDPEGPYPLRRETSRFPLWERSDASPELPTGFGISFHAERVAVVENNKPLLLHGAWRLPIAGHEIVKPASEEHNAANHLLRAGGKTPFAACVSLYLLAVGSANANPFLYRLRLPVIGPLADGAKGPEASGYFTVDLSQLPDFPLTDQSIIAYGYSKEWASTPITIGIVDRRK